jgi:signal transduction histidine kinase
MRFRGKAASCAVGCSVLVTRTAFAATGPQTSAGIWVAALIAALWLIAAGGAILWGVQAGRRTRSLQAWAGRVQAMLGSNPQAALILSATGTLQVADSLRQWVNIGRKITRLDDLAPTGSSGIAEPDYSRLCADIEALRSTATAFDRVARTVGGRTLLAQGRVLDGADLRSGTIIVWFSDVREPLAIGSQQAVEQVSLLQDLDAATAMLEAAPFPIWRRDSALRLKHVNSAYVRAVDGRNASDVIARNLELVPPMQAEVVRDTARQLSSDTRTVIDGVQRTLSVHDIPLGDTGIGGFAIDITSRIDAERELQRHMQAHRDTLDMLSAPVAIFGADQKLTFHNVAFERLFNLPAEWLAEKPGHGDLLDRLRDTRKVPEKSDFMVWKRSILRSYTSLLQPQEDMWQLPDDTTLRVVTQPHPRGGLQLLIEDVTPRLVLERSYNTLIQVQQATLNNLHEGAAVIRADGAIRLTNAAFGKLWHHDPDWLADEPRIDQWLEKTSSLFVSSAAQEKLADAIRNIIVERRTITGHLERSDGLTLTYTGIPLPDGSALLTFLDVTDSARIERALRDRNDALVAADRLKTEFMENMSYELRTPLTTIIGFSEMLDKGYFGILTPKQLEYLKGILESSQQLDGLIADLLDLAGTGSGTVSLSRAKMNVHDFLTAVCADQEAAAAQRKIHFRADIDASVGEAELDSRRLAQILTKLLENSFAFTPKGQAVTVRATGDATQIIIDVSDAGVGIASADLPHVFERFRRGANASNSKGVGLGLALVKHFVELHGGTVQIASDAGVGTTVQVNLPRLAAPARQSFAA